MTQRYAPEKLLAVANALAEQAGHKVLSFQNKPLKKSRKADQSPVTEADLASDTLIREGLAAAFPDHGILTEENGVLGDVHSEYLWVVDPLDGTKAFAKGIPGFCIMVGLLRDGIPYLGVVKDPLEGRRYEAIRGGGAFCVEGGGRHSLRVSERTDFSQMPLVISTGFPEKKLEETLNILGSPLVDPINSVGIKVGLLVRKIGDIYINHHGVHYWDTCAPQVILEEAGGRFTKLNGNSLAYNLDGVFNHQSPTLASNSLRHEELVKILDGVGMG